MRIYCPDCNSCYEIDAVLIPEKGKKMRCGTCGHIFLACRGDLLPEPEMPTPTLQEEIVEPITEPQGESVSEESLIAQGQSGDEMKEIFERLSAQTDDLFKSESELPFYKKLAFRFRLAFGLTSRANRWLWVFISLGVIALSAYNFRYEIVRAVPSFNIVYKTLKIKATIPGEGLAFNNITWNKFEEDYVDKLEIKGFVVNPTNRELVLPIIHVELLDNDAVVLQQLDQKPSITTLNPGSRVAISIIVKKPALTTKYVILTFHDRQDR